MAVHVAAQTFESKQFDENFMPPALVTFLLHLNRADAQQIFEWVCDNSDSAVNKILDTLDESRADNSPVIEGR